MKARSSANTAAPTAALPGNPGKTKGMEKNMEEEPGQTPAVKEDEDELTIKEEEDELTTKEKEDELTTRQKLAVDLYVQGKNSLSEIAEQAGYSDKTSVSRFVNSEKGREAVKKALEERVSYAGIVGLQALIECAGQERNWLAKRQAAADLVGLAGLRLEGEKVERSEGGQVLIQINTGGPPAPGMIDVSKAEK